MSLDRSPTSLRRILLAGVGALALAPIPAMAQQSGDIVMRRPITSDQVNEAAWDVTQWSRVRPEGSSGPWCGSYQEVRQVECRRQPDGQPVADQFCSSPKPPEAQIVTDESGCTYSWRTGDWLNPGDSCGSETETRSVLCRRDNDDLLVDDSRCSGARPDSAQTVMDYATCSHSWETGAFVDPGSACTAAEVQERTVRCKRDLDGQTVDEDLCGASPKPSLTQTVPDYSACSHSWNAGAWNEGSASCTAAETQTRAVTCRRDLDGATVDDSLCSAGPKPTVSQQVEDRSGCSYSWAEGGWGNWSSSCSTTATRSQAVTCRRSDGTDVADSFCSATPKPDIEQTSSQTGGCSYAANWGTWGNWSSTCSTNASRTRTATCRRSDGATVPNSECTSRGIALTESETSQQLGGCGYSANWGNWGNWSSSCSTNATRSRTATCRRSDGTTVSNSECTSRGVALSESETSQQLGGCDYSANWGNWGNWSSSCSTSATRSRSAICRRSDGTTVSNSECTSRGVALTESETSQQLGGCDYSANWGAWGNWSSSCSTNATRSRSATCRRSDGTTVSNSECTSRGVALTEIETSQQLGGCDYSAVNWSGWGAWSSTCSHNATRTQTAQCRRGDGTIVAASECTNRGVSLTQSESGPVYSGCGYTWDYGAWNQGAASCTANETQTRSVTCRRSIDNAVVADSFCNAGSRESSTRTVEDYSGCQYTAEPGSWSQCVSGSQSRSVSCRRSDGVLVQPSFCGLQSSTQTQNCTYYEWEIGAYSGWSACSNSQQFQTRSVVCRARPSGTAVADDLCPQPTPQRTNSQGCTSAATSSGGEVYHSDGGAGFAGKPINGLTVFSGQIDAGVGQGNYNYEGLSCGFSIAVTYNGQTDTISGSAGTTENGACSAYGNANIGGRNFSVTLGFTRLNLNMFEYRVSVQ